MSRRPREVVVQDLSGLIVANESHVHESLMEAGDRPSIHFFVRPVPAVHPHNRALVP